MLKRILNWRWFLPLTFVALLFIATLFTRITQPDEFWPSFFAAGGMSLLVVIFILLGRYRPAVLETYFASWTDQPARRGSDTVAALEQLTLAVEQCDDGHTPKPIHDAAERARATLDRLKPRS